MLQLLHGQSTGVERLFIRAASCIIIEMLAQYPELARKYILSSIIGPLAQTTYYQGTCCELVSIFGSYVKGSKANVWVEF